MREWTLISGDERPHETEELLDTPEAHRGNYGDDTGPSTARHRGSPTPCVLLAELETFCFASALEAVGSSLPHIAGDPLSIGLSAGVVSGWIYPAHGRGNDDRT